MRKFHSIAALCGDGLRPELQALFDRLAIDPHSEFFVRSDGMTQSGPDPMQDFSERSPKTAPAQGLGRLESEIGIGGSLAAPPLPHHRTYGSVYGGSRSYANALRSNDSTRVGWAFGLIHRRE